MVDFQLAYNGCSVKVGSTGLICGESLSGKKQVDCHRPRMVEGVQSVENKGERKAMLRTRKLQKSFVSDQLQYSTEIRLQKVADFGRSSGEFSVGCWCLAVLFGNCGTGPSLAVNCVIGT